MKSTTVLPHSSTQFFELQLKHLVIVIDQRCNRVERYKPSACLEASQEDDWGSMPQLRQIKPNFLCSEKRDLCVEKTPSGSLCTG